MTASQGNKTMQDSGTRTRKNIAGSGAKTQKAQMVNLTRQKLRAMPACATNGYGDGIAGVSTARLSTWRIDKQNRGKTGVTMRQFDRQYFEIRMLTWRLASTPRAPDGSALPRRHIADLLDTVAGGWRDYSTTRAGGWRTRVDYGYCDLTAQTVGAPHG